MNISTTEVLRYLGYGSTPADMRLEEIITKLHGEFVQHVKPKSISGVWECTVTKNIITLEPLVIISASLAEHLHGCRQAILMAATLGIEADALLRRYAALDMEKALIAEAVCSVMIEEYITATFPGERFSPGYGDFSIVHQKDILRLLNCAARIGLAMTDGYMLTPSKSVTAIVRNNS